MYAQGATLIRPL